MSSQPLIIIGLDAADPELLMEWTEEGSLPGLAAIMKQGCYGRIGGNEYVTSHGLWLSLFTGSSRAQHSYYYFRQFQPSTHTMKVCNPRQTNALPFWRLLQSENGRTAVIDAPETYPLPSLSGVQLANYSVHNAPEGVSAEPASFLKQVERICGSQIIIREDVNSDLHQDRKTYLRILERIKNTGKLCNELLTRERFDCFVLGFSETHVGGHQFWKYHKQKGQDLQNALRQVYHAIDLQIRRIQDLAPEGANIFVLSTMGIRDQNPSGGLTRSFCRTLGYHVQNKTSVPTLNPFLLGKKFIPEKIRLRLSSALSLQTRQRLLSNNFHPQTDWSSTTAFSLPSEYTGMIRINLRGRERQGIIEPGREYEQLLQQIENDLNELIDPITDQAAVAQVHRTAALYGTDGSRLLPDLFVKWKPTRHFQEVLYHPRGAIRQKKPQYYRTNSHTEHGFFAAAGPSIVERGEMPQSSLLDFAPRFIQSLGISTGA